MSRNRVKNISFEDDDYYDEDEYGEEGELSPEDREQMRLRTAEVQQLLRSELPPIEAQENEIWESLWHYYYDVDKTVAYLRKKYRPAPKTAPTTPVKKKTKDSSYPIPSSPCSAQFSARDFFRDSPWLNIPNDRKADILIEPLYPHFGLLGGASEGPGKMSKLAALAAARKKKESEKNKVNGDESLLGRTPAETPRTSISLLDRLASNGKPKTTSEQRPSRFALRKADRTSSHSSQEKSTTNLHADNAPSKQPLSPVTLPVECPKEQKVLPIEILAQPSSFAAVMVGIGSNRESLRCFLHDLNMLKLYGEKHTESFNFAEPSPDDVVINAQNAAKANKAKQTKAQVVAKAASELPEDVKQLSMQDSVKPKSKQLDVLEEHRKAKRKKAANFVVIGHVDAGKSTLMGRLLYDLKAVDQRTIEKYKREADRIGKGSFHLAWVLDQGSEERARGVTIDIATNKFETESTLFTVLDAPGHRDFVPNMIAGASQADFAVLVIDASTGNFESGLKGQTKEHALLVRSMGVQKMVVAVNKMDSVAWSKERFEEIEQQISSFLETAGFQPKNISFVPCSGLRGDNIITRTEDKKASWYSGRTLIQELETSEPYSYAIEKPLRMTIGDVFKGGPQNQLSVSGRIEAGSLQVGDRIISMPSGETSIIKSLEIDHEPSDWAVAGNNIVLHPVDIDPTHLKTGDVICSPSSPIQNTKSFTAKVLAFDHLTPMQVELHRGRLHVPGRISQLIAILDKTSGAPSKRRPKIMAPGMVARIQVEVDQAIPLEAPARVVLRAGGETVAAGLLE